MTIEDIIHKFIFNITVMEKRGSFSGPELYRYVCQQLYKFNRRRIEEQSVLRCLRRLRDRNDIDYDVVDQTTYIINPKRK